MLQRRFANGALEQEHLVGKLDRIAMGRLFPAAPGILVDQRIDLETLLFGEVIDIVDQLVEFVDTGDGVALPPTMERPDRPFGGLQRIVGVVIHGDEIKFDLGATTGFQPFSM